MNRSVVATLSLLFVFGCSGGFSCGSCANAYPFPQTQAAVPAGTEFVEGGMRMRLTQGALDFLQENIRDLLAAQLGSDPNYPGYIVVTIPGTTTIVSGSAGSLQLGGFGGESYPTKVLIDANAFNENLEFTLDDAANGIRIRADNVPVGLEARVYGQAEIVFNPTAACNIVGSSPASGAGIITTLSIDMLVTPDVGRLTQCDSGEGECLLLDINVVSVALGDIGGNSIDISAATDCADDPSRNCSAECSDSSVPTNDFECISLCGATDFVVDLALGIVGFITPFIEPFLDNLLNTAIRNALDGINGAPLSFSSRLDTGTLAGGALPVTALDLGFAVAPTGSAFDVNNPAGNAEALGMDLILKSGFEAALPLDTAEETTLPHPCVRPIAGANFQQLYGDGQFRANNLPPLTGVFEGQPYHLGASMASAALNQILFATYNSGALCIELTSEGVATLTNGEFTLSAAQLDLLTGGRLRQFAAAEAPAVIALAPSQPPIIGYGAGTIDEGHIKVQWPAVEVSFYVEMYERYTRVFAVSTDINLEMSVFNDPGTETLRFAIVQGPTVDNFQTNYNELLVGIDFTEVLATLVGVVLDGVVGDGLEFNYDVGPALTTALGGAPVFVDFMGLETSPAANRQALNVYLRLTNSQPNPQLVGTRRLSLAPNPAVIRLPEAEQARFALPTGRVHVEVDDTDDREYFARVDFGMWRGPLRPSRGELVVEDPKLRLSGAHDVTVRGRIIGAPNTLESEGTALSVRVWVDGQAPQLRLVRDGASLHAAATDDHAAVDELRVEWQVDDGVYVPGAASQRLADLEGRFVRAKVCDPAGNCSKPVGTSLEIERRRADDAAELEVNRAAGCSQRSLDVSWLGLVMVVMLGRRRSQPNATGRR